MPIAIINSSSGGTVGAQTSWTIPVPVNTLNNHFMFLQVNLRGNTSSSVTTPTGWTLITSKTRATNGRVFWFYRYAFNEPASYTLTANAAATHHALMITLSGVSTSSPINTFATADSGTGTTNHVTPSITTTVNNALIVLTTATATTEANVLYSSWPSVTIQQNNRGTDSAASGTGVSALGTIAQVSAGIQGTTTAVYPESRTFATGTFAITPAEATPPIVTPPPWLMGV